MRSKSASRIISIISAVLLASFFCFGQKRPVDRKSQDWLTWGGDPERTSWNRNESILSKANVGNLELKWKAQIDKEVSIEIESGASMLTGPLVVNRVQTSKGTKNLVFTLSAANTLAALDAETGAIVWERTFTNKVPPPSPATWVCTNTQTATPVIDQAKGTIDLLSADGVLHLVSLANGEDKAPPIDFVPPYSRNWSLNLVDGVIYTTVGRGCGAASSKFIPSAMMAMDLNDPSHPIAKFQTSDGRPSGAWGRGGLVYGFNAIYTQTADGTFDPSDNKWGQCLLKLSPRTLKLEDYFTPPNLEEVNELDLDFGSGEPFPFTFENRDLIAAAGKDGTLYLLDAKSPGGADHRTPLFSLKIGNDAKLYASNGMWGAMATYTDSRNARWIYVPMWGPPAKAVPYGHTNGEAPDGNIQGFKVVMENQGPKLTPMWVSRNLAMPDPPVIANGLVFAISTGENTLQRHTDPRYQQLYRKPTDPPLSTRGILSAQQRGMNTTHVTLYAFDAETGQELFSSKDGIDDWTHLSTVTVADGQVYVVTRKSFVYAFGLPKK